MPLINRLNAEALLSQISVPTLTAFPARKVLGVQWFSIRPFNNKIIGSELVVSTTLEPHGHAEESRKMSQRHLHTG